MASYTQYNVNGYRPLTYGDDQYRMGGFNSYASIDGLGGNDTFTLLSNSVSNFSSFIGGQGEDRLTLEPLTRLDGISNFYGGPQVDTLEITTSAPVVMNSYQVADINRSFGTYVSMSIQMLNSNGYIQAVDVERFVINAGANVDYLRGGVGDDWLDGGGNYDYFVGSTGNDGYVFDRSGEFVSGTDPGTDTIWTSASQDLRNSSDVENLRLQSGDINGTGNALANTITGSAGNNVIAGGLGKDQLWGKGGNDTFSFAEMGSENRDTIYDFNEGDRIQLSKAAFAGLDANNDGMLDAISLTGKAAGGAYAQLIYSAKTGVLSYDADGTGSGAAQEIAVIGKNLGFLGTDDFLLVA